MAFQCLSWKKYQINNEYSHVLRMIILVSQLLCWQQCPLHLSFVQTQLLLHLFQLHDACALTGAVVKVMSKLGIQLYVETSSFTRHFQLCSFTLLPMPCQMPETGKSHIQVTHFQILQLSENQIFTELRRTFVAPLSRLQTFIKGHEALPLSSHH